MNMNQVGNSPAPYNLERVGTPVSGYVFSDKLPALPGDPQQVRLKIGIEAARGGTAALVKSIGLKVDALALSTAAAEHFAGSFQVAATIEFTHIRNTGMHAQRVDFGAADLFTRSARCALSSFVAAGKQGLSSVEAHAYVGRAVGMLSGDGLPAEAICLRSTAIAIASAIVAKIGLDAVDAAINPTAPVAPPPPPTKRTDGPAVST
jgi:hypothetical protein